jgi:hypothetical protein
MDELEHHGVPARPNSNPLHLQPFDRQRSGFQTGDHAITKQVARSTLPNPPRVAPRSTDAWAPFSELAPARKATPS